MGVAAGEAREGAVLALWGGGAPFCVVRERARQRLLGCSSPFCGVLRRNVGNESLRELAGHWLRSGVGMFLSKLVSASWRRQFGGCRWSSLTIHVFPVQVVTEKV